MRALFFFFDRGLMARKEEGIYLHLAQIILDIPRVGENVEPEAYGWHYRRVFCPLPHVSGAAVFEFLSFYKKNVCIHSQV